MIPFGSFKIGNISGIDIEINYTWFVIFFLVTAALAFAYFPTVYPQLSVTVNIINGILTSLLFFSSVLFHELMHSSVALRNGLVIRKITLFIFGGVSQMEDEPPTAGIEFKMAIAGPLSSIALAFVFGGIFFLLFSAKVSPAFYAPYGWLSLINGLLGLFNLVPGFPLDGGRVFRAALWAFFKDIKRATKIASRFGQGFAYSLIILGLIMIFRGFLDGLWLVLIGWFLNNAAKGSYQQLILRSQLGDVKVEQLMMKDIEVISPDLNLNQVVEDYFINLKKECFPVANEQANFIGTISLNDVRSVPKDEWQKTAVKDAAKPASSDRYINSQEEAITALMQMSQENKDQLLVVDDGELKGLITKRDISGLIKIRSRLGTETEEAA